MVGSATWSEMSLNRCFVKQINDRKTSRSFILSLSRDLQTRSMIRRYIVLFENSFRSRDWERFGCNVFAAQGFQIVAVQTIDAPFEDFPGPVLRCYDRTALDQSIGVVQAEDIVLNLVVLSPGSEWIYDWLREGRVRYMVMSRGGFALSFIGFASALGVWDWLRLCAGELRLWVGAKYRWFMRYREILYAPAPRWWLRAGRRGDAFANPLYPRLNCAEVLPMLHFDAEEARSAPEYSAARQPYAVFLDQVMIDHPELELMKMSSEVDPERYHPALERCFLAVEDQTGLDVIVAPHPKATQQSRARFGHRVVDAPTASLVRGSSLVLCHYTTAVSFPVIFHKPVLFLTSDKMETNASGVMVARLSSWLGSRRVNIDHLPPRVSIPSIAEARYRRYQQAFLYSDAPLDWKGVFARITC